MVYSLHWTRISLDERNRQAAQSSESTPVESETNTTQTENNSQATLERNNTDTNSSS